MQNCSNTYFLALLIFLVFGFCLHMYLCKFFGDFLKIPIWSHQSIKNLFESLGSDSQYTHPFILRPQFLQFLEIWFEKSGSRNLVREIWFENSGWPEKKMVLYHRSSFFQVGEKRLTRIKNPSLQNHFSRTTFLYFSRIVVAE